MCGTRSPACCVPAPPLPLTAGGPPPCSPRTVQSRLPETLTLVLEPGSSTVTSFADVNSHVKPFPMQTLSWVRGCVSLPAEAPGDDTSLRTSRDPLQDAGSQVLPHLAGLGGGPRSTFYRVPQVMGTQAARGKDEEPGTGAPDPTLAQPVGTCPLGSHLSSPAPQFRVLGPCPAGQSSHVSCTKQGWASLATHLATRITQAARNGSAESLGQRLPG